jgi:hypothetical protein
MDAIDLLVHSPRVISNITNRMYDIKLLRYRNLHYRTLHCRL